MYHVLEVISKRNKMFQDGEYFASKLPLPLTCVYDNRFISTMNSFTLSLDVASEFFSK